MLCGVEFEREEVGDRVCVKDGVLVREGGREGGLRNEMLRNGETWLRHKGRPSIKKHSTHPWLGFETH